MDDEIPRGNVPEERPRGGMDGADKIMMALLIAGILVLVAVICVAIRAALGLVGLAMTGPGLRVSILTGFGVSLAVTTLLAMVAGDGILGEFPAVLSAFLLIMTLTTLIVFFIF